MSNIILDEGLMCPKRWIYYSIKPNNQQDFVGFDVNTTYNILFYCHLCGHSTHVSTSQSESRGERMHVRLISNYLELKNKVY